MSSRYQQKQGFTLIEMLVVITVILIILAIAVPSLGEFSRRRAIAGAAGIIQGACIEARGLAITRRRIHRVDVYVQDSGTISAGSVFVFNNTTNTQEGQMQKMPEFIELEHDGGSANPVQVFFFPDGSVSSEETINITQEGVVLEGVLTVRQNSGRAIIRINEGT